jgi:hypothetical protein
VTGGDTDPGRQLITVIRKGSRALQQLPASSDAFVWLRLYQLQTQDLVPSGPDQPLWWTLRRPCIRCPLLRVDRDQRPRLAAIRDNLTARIEEAQRESWTGEAEGLTVSLAATEQKLSQLDGLKTRRNTIHLGLPSFPDVAGRSSTNPDTRPS